LLEAVAVVEVWVMVLPICLAVRHLLALMAVAVKTMLLLFGKVEAAEVVEEALLALTL
jgi:hypothetical protein